MSGFIRRYLSDPGLEELLAIEGVVIIDREPPAAITGQGSGTVVLVAEFEKGSYKPQEVSSAQDILQLYGGFGFTYSGIAGNNPCARSRKADSALTPEYWNGNGYVALAGKKFRRLILVRVDTTVGSVTFTRLAYLVGNNQSTWKLTPGAALSVKVDGAGATSIAWAAAAAVYTGTAGSYPYAPAGGETMTITVDAGTSQAIGPVVVTFTNTDTSQALVMARINAAVGYAVATDGTGNKITLTGRVNGTGGSVNITQITTTLATAIGLTTGSHAGTGNVVDINQVTFAEAKARIEGVASGLLVEQDYLGRIVMASKTTTGTRSVEVVSASTTATAFGFAMDAPATPTTVGVDGVLSAGTEVQTAGGVSWVTADDIPITAASAGPYTVKVRPSVDDGTTVGAVPGEVTVVAAIPTALGMWAVTNTLALTAALTEAQLDAAYLAAIDLTLAPNGVVKQGNIINSARQSNAIRYKLRSNALDASSSGLRGRSAIIRPPLGTTRAQARSDTLQPGVGAYRDQRVFYAYPGGRAYIPQIAALGTNGGAGFTADGLIDVGSDTWLASVCSQLPPEENPGQLTTFMANLLGLEANNADIQNLTMADYELFKAAGICAPRLDEGTMIFQSGITSVDPGTYPALVNIARRRMADYIQDSLAIGLRPFTKKLSTRSRRASVVGMIEAFLGGLVSKNNPDNQRIDSYLTNYKDGNTAQTLALGLFRVIIKVRTLPGMNVIVLDTQIGEGVLTINELPVAA